MVERCEDLDVLPLYIIADTGGQNNTCVSCQDETCFHSYSLTEFKVYLLAHIGFGCVL